MCECLEYEDGTRHTCEACVDDLETMRGLLVKAEAENARLNEALANWHDNEARWIGNSERYPDADLREARSVLRDLAASASIRRAALAPAAPGKEGS